MALAKIRQTPLKMTNRGYVRNLGYTDPPIARRTQVKFYLGKDIAEAAKRRRDIELLFLESSRRLGGNDMWHIHYLPLARQIEKTGFALINTDNMEAKFILQLRATVKRLLAADVKIQFEDEDFHVQAGQKKNIFSSVTFAKALQAYKENRLNEYSGAFQGKKALEKQIEQFEQIKDCNIADFNYTRIKEVIDHWKKRPKTKHGTQCSQSYAINQIGEFTKFLNWTDATYPEFELPNLASIDKKVPKLATDKKGNAIVEMFWTPEDLKEVFRTAQPLTKLIIALGLNTCSNPAELGRFKVDDFYFDQLHPMSNAINYHEKQNWLITIRHKTFSLSNALLWDWVADLVKEQIEVCKANNWVYLFTEDGEPLYRHNEVYLDAGLEPPDTEKPESRFVTRFNNAVTYAKKRITKKYSIGKLRKTFSNYLTMNNSGELGSLALSHKAHQDELLHHYANKPYKRLFEATIEHENFWNLTTKAS